MEGKESLFEKERRSLCTRPLRACRGKDEEKTIQVQPLSGPRLESLTCTLLCYPRSHRHWRILQNLYRQDCIFTCITCKSCMLICAFSIEIGIPSALFSSVFENPPHSFQTFQSGSRLFTFFPVEKILHAIQIFENAYCSTMNFFLNFSLNLYFINY